MAKKLVWWVWLILFGLCLPTEQMGHVGMMQESRQELSLMKTLRQKCCTSKPRRSQCSTVWTLLFVSCTLPHTWTSYPTFPSISCPYLLWRQFSAGRSFYEVCREAKLCLFLQWLLSVGYSWIMGVNVMACFFFFKGGWAIAIRPY